MVNMNEAGPVSPPAPNASVQTLSAHHLVAIGSSAGGLEALRAFIATLPGKTSTLSFIIAQHTNPAHESRLVELLARHTALEVVPVKNRGGILPGVIYVTPPGYDCKVKNGETRLKKTSTLHCPSVDALFKSVAESYRDQGIGIIFSGTGNDGAEGIKAIKKRGGLTIAEDPREAQYQGMPQAAIDTRAVDLVLKPSKVIAHINHYVRHRKIKPGRKTTEPTPEAIRSKILAYLTEQRGTDFSNYRSAMILRRMERRCLQLQLPGLAEYLAHIEQQPGEVDVLYQHFLIGVTSFFRDNEAFALLGRRLADVMTRKRDEAPIRAWVPGCATGEEAYTIAILFREMADQTGTVIPIQIFASDIDEKALKSARQGIFEADKLVHLHKKLLKKYFIKTGLVYEVVKSLRSMVLFSRHDVTNDPPFLKLDLISCRNLLIYFNQQLQSQVIATFHYALNQEGLLLLGKSERVASHSALFSCLHAKHKLFAKEAAIVQRHLPGRNNPGRLPGKTVAPTESLSVEELLKETMYEQFDFPYVVVNAKMDMVRVQGEVFPYLRIRQGETTLNVVKNAHPKLQIEVRGLLTACMETNKKRAAPIRYLEHQGGEAYLRLRAYPVGRGESSQRLYLLAFEPIDPRDFSGIPFPRTEAAEGRQLPGTAALENELNETKAHLQSFIEELETTNEELQATNEELQSTVEELHAANEELATSNEELQSAHEETIAAYHELHQANQTLKEKDAQLTVTLDRFHLLLQHARQGYLLLQADYTISVFNAEAQRISRLISHKTLREGESLLSYVDGPYVDSFKANFEATLKGKLSVNENTVTVGNGQLFFRTQYIPVSGFRKNIDHVLISYEELTAEITAQRKIAESEVRFRSLIEHSADGIMMADATGQVQYESPFVAKMLGYDPGENLGRPIFELIHPEDLPLMGENHRRISENPGQPFYLNARLRKKSGEYIHTEGTVTNLLSVEGVNAIVSNVRDVTERKENELKISESEQKYRYLFENNPMPMWITDTTDFRILQVNQAAIRHYGYGREKFLSMTALDIRAEEERERFLRMNHLADEGFSQLGTWKLLKEGGTVVQVEVSASRITFEGKAARLVLANDVTEKKRVEQTLRRSEARFRRIFESRMVGFLFWDANGNILEANERFLELVGYTQQDLREGHIHWNAMTPPEYADSDRHGLEQIRLKGICEPFEKEYFRKDGSRLPIEIGAATLEEGDSEKGVAYILDITERKKSDEALQKSFDEIRAASERQLSILNSLNAHIALLDGEGKIIEVNEAWKSFADHNGLASSNYCIRDNYIDLSDNATGEEETAGKAIATAIREVLAGRKSEFSIEYPCDAPQESRWFRASVTPLYQNRYGGAVVSHINITDRKRAEAALQQSEANLRTIFDHADTGYILTDTSFNVISFNQPARIFMQENLGTELTENLGSVNCFPPERQEVLKEMRGSVMKGTPFTYETNYPQPDGPDRWYYLRFFPVWNSEKKITGFITALTDFTERKTAELYRDKITADLIQRNKDLEQFTYIVSHNLRAPVANILGFANVMKFPNISDENREELLKGLSVSVKKLDEVIMDLNVILQVKQESNQRKETVYFKDLIDDIQFSIQQLLREERVRILTDFAPVSGLQIVRSYLYSIFFNLISNSIKYRREGVDPVIEIASEKTVDNRVVLTFRDNGRGIDLHKRGDQVFGLYKRFHTEIEGKGIGLFMVKTQVESLGGKITVTSEVDKGTTFSIEFGG